MRDMPGLWTCQCYQSHLTRETRKGKTNIRVYLHLYSSNPRSPNYGKHMTVEEVTDFFAPAQSSVDAVIDWLVSAGIDRKRISQSANKQVSCNYVEI